MLDLNKTWAKALDILSNEISKPTFEMWLKSSQFLSFDDGIIVIGLINEMAKNWLEVHEAEKITNALKKVVKKKFKLKFVILDNIPEEITESAEYLPNEEIILKENNENHQTKESDVKEKIEKTDATPDKTYSPLNPKYLFDSFVIGNSNRFAHAASLAVAEAPGRVYNPLFIYGGVGLGKTHLMHAIGHQVLEQNPDTKVAYISSETFINELINAIKDDTNKAFRDKYRKMDILLIDDIQFLSKKERTQEEFFHTFNTLYEANKQIIISSDRPPKEIPALEERLRSRFEMGLIADIQPPDFETRIAILRKKIETENISVPDDVIIDIAKRIKANIRELEGALIRVVAYSSVTKREIDINLSQEALKDLLPQVVRNQALTISLVQQVVANRFNIDVHELKGKKRSRNIAYPRQIAMYLSRELTESSLPKIGEEFGGRDHTTVMHAYDKIKEDLNSDPTVKTTIEELIENLKNS